MGIIVVTLVVYSKCLVNSTYLIDGDDGDGDGDGGDGGDDGDEMFLV